MNKLSGLQLQNYRPLRDVVFEHLRNAILSGDLKPSERLMEVQIAEQLGVSRTPVREAIRKLELEGLVMMVARKGAYVADISIKDILDVLEVRSVLEGLSASLAAKRMTEDSIEDLKKVAYDFEQCIENKDTQGMILKDQEFHDCIIRSTKNDRLIQISQTLEEQIQRFRTTYFIEYRQPHILLKDHQEILEAIVSRDEKRAQIAAHNHINALKETIMKLTDQNI